VFAFASFISIFGSAPLSFRLYAKNTVVLDRNCPGGESFCTAALTCGNTL
jgi:hypothetical protein